MLYLANDVMKLLDTKEVVTRFGNMAIYKFGLFNRSDNKR
jgi:hypothetical protein